VQLKPGTRLESVTCAAQVVVVKAPPDDVDVRCGGEPMQEIGAGGERRPMAVTGDATLIGKRYADEDLGIELLCTRAGEGSLSVADRPLLVKGSKPLPSSD